LPGRQLRKADRHIRSVQADATCLVGLSINDARSAFILAKVCGKH
jgi:hypothetical protein